MMDGLVTVALGFVGTAGASTTAQEVVATCQSPPLLLSQMPLPFSGAEVNAMSMTVVPGSGL